MLYITWHGQESPLTEGNATPALPASASHTENKGSIIPTLCKVGEVTSVKGLKPLDGKCH